MTDGAWMVRSAGWATVVRGAVVVRLDALSFFGRSFLARLLGTAAAALARVQCSPLFLTRVTLKLCRIPIAKLV